MAKKEWTWDDVRPEMRFAQQFFCLACGAKKGEMCWKNNGSRRRTPHGPRRGRPELDWPGPPGGTTAHPYSRKTKGWQNDK